MSYFELDERGRGLDRVLAFSDGVFAIAITLLVLAFRVPTLHGADVNRRLFHALLHQGGLLIGFAVSFFVIARLWIVHHRLSLLLRHIDARFISLNMVFLAMVVIVPFPAEIVGLYGGTTTGVVFYASTMVVVLTMSGVVSDYAFRYHLVDERVSPDARRVLWIRVLFAVAVFALSIPVAFVDPGHAQLVWLILVVQHPVMVRLGAAEPLPSLSRPGKQR